MQTERHSAASGNLHRRGASDDVPGWSSAAGPFFGAANSGACPISDRPLCPECAAELTDPASRRYGYAFTTCGECGPRRSILARGPFVRENTSMAGYAMCDACLDEYLRPGGRRHRDEAASCPACGPTLRALERDRTTIASGEPLRLAANSIGEGRIVALRDERRDSLLCDATSPSAVLRLRALLGLVDVPLVVMVRDLDEAIRVAEPDPKQLSLLTSVERPVVLVSIRTDSPLTGEVAAGNRLVGLLLPYSPLHHLLLNESGRPLVILPAGVPDALPRPAAATLLGMADLVLVGDRSAAGGARISGRPDGRETSKSRVVRLAAPASRVILACGGTLPGAVALATDDEVTIAPAEGSYGEHHAAPRFEDSIERVEATSTQAVEVLVHDFDERLDSTRYALDQTAVSHVAVQQQHAEMAACLAENAEAGSALGVVFDFGGLGTDGTVWGGEFFRGTVGEVERLATLRPIRLAGEHISTRQIWRVALAMVDEAFACEPPLHAVPLFRSIPRRGIDVVRRVIASGPTVSSHAAGLQMEALAAIVLDRQDSPWPGALIAEWESLEDRSETGRYPMVIRDGAVPWEIDFRLVVEGAVADLIDGVPGSTILARAGNSIVAAAVEVLRAHGADRVPVAITGTMFEEGRFAERIAAALGERAMVLRPRALGAGPGALVYGQVIVADALLRRSASRHLVNQQVRMLNER